LRQILEQIHTSEIGDILENSLAGKKPEFSDYERLLESDDVHIMGMVAGELARKRFGKKASFVNKAFSSVKWHCPLSRYLISRLNPFHKTW